MSTKILAHRGASDYAPENTMVAFELANKMQADGLEIDVHLTKDQVLVVTHDEEISRVSNGGGYIKDLTLAQLREYNFANGYTEEDFYPIPTLEEVLTFVKDNNLILNIELKNSIIVYPDLEEKTLQAVRAFDLEKNVIFSSFNHYSIVKLKKLGTISCCGLLYDAPLYEPWKYCQSIGSDALHPHFGNLIIPDYVKNSHDLKIQVNPWTVNDATAMKNLFHLDVDAIITNKPDLAVEIRRTFTNN